MILSILYLFILHFLTYGFGKIWVSKNIPLYQLLIYDCMIKSILKSVQLIFILQTSSY